MDFVFRNDAPDFIVNKDTTVEKLGHAYHMQNLWTETQPYYFQLKENPPENADQVTFFTSKVVQEWRNANWTSYLLLWCR